MLPPHKLCALRLLLSLIFATLFLGEPFGLPIKAGSSFDKAGSLSARYGIGQGASGKRPTVSKGGSCARIQWGVGSTVSHRTIALPTTRSSTCSGRTWPPTHTSTFLPEYHTLRVFISRSISGPQEFLCCRQGHYSVPRGACPLQASFGRIDRRSWPQLTYTQHLTMNGSR